MFHRSNVNPQFWRDFYRFRGNDSVKQKFQRTKVLEPFAFAGSGQNLNMPDAVFFPVADCRFDKCAGLISRAVAVVFIEFICAAFSRID